MGRPIRLDLPSLTEKLIRGQRGGYCFEQNALLAAVLEQLGFKVTRLLARVRIGGERLLPRTHMVLEVAAEGESWLAEVCTKPSGPLAGIKVLDLTSVLYGPYASQTLGDWGAEVIKIEPLTGDTWRYSGQFRNRGMTGQFMAVNRNKRSLALDLKQPDGKSVLQRLIATADVLLTNIRPAALARLGFGYEACQQINPRLVYAAATGFGQDGPWAARPAFDEVIQASSGFASAMGSDDEPAFVPSLVADKICGLTIVGAVSAALVHRERTGKGQMVEVPMLETITAFNSIEMLGGHAFDPPIGPGRLQAHEGAAAGAHQGRLADDAALLRRKLVHLFRSRRPSRMH